MLFSADLPTKLVAEPYCIRDPVVIIDKARPRPKTFRLLNQLVVPPGIVPGAQIKISEPPRLHRRHEICQFNEVVWWYVGERPDVRMDKMSHFQDCYLAVTSGVAEHLRSGSRKAIVES